MKRFCDRRDGTRIKNGGFAKFLYCLKPRRSDSEVYISRELDVTKLREYYIDKKKKNSNITYFHLFSTAIAKLIYNKPLLNRFVINGNYYDRNEVTLSFVAKTSFEDNAQELLTVLRIKTNDNIDTISDKINGDVKKIRSSKKSHLDDFVDKLGAIPKFIMKIIVAIIRFMDNHDLVPYSLTKNSIYHSTVLLSNLGSIHCDGIYHNLTNIGTNSIIVTMGEVKEIVKVIDGKIVTKWGCQFGITLDERIADGVYYAKCVNLLQEIFDNPKLLEEDVDAKVNISKS